MPAPEKNINSSFEAKTSQRTTRQIWTKFFSSGQILKRKFYNESDFE